MNVLLSGNPDATKVAETPLKFWSPSAFLQRGECNICSGACGPPVLGSNCYIARTGSGGERSRESLSSLKRAGATLRADIRARGERQMSGHLLSRYVAQPCQGDAGKGIPNFGGNFLQLRPGGVKSGWPSARRETEKTSLERGRCVRGLPLG